MDYMKKALTLLIGCLVCGLVVAQPVVKGHAWKQQSARGAKPSAVAGEAGNKAARAAAGSGTLHIFLEFKPAQNIVPYRIWIDGKPYRVASDRKTGSVIWENASAGSGSENDTLVAPTKNQIVQVTAVAPLTKLTLPALDAVSANATNGKIVVEYYWKARRYAYTIPEIKMLPAVRLQ
jgi:hypothetical protein